MNWAWATSLDQLWHSPAFAMWVTLAAAGFFGIILLVTLLRAERSVANGTLTVITLLAIAVAGAATFRGFGPGSQSASGETRSSQPISVALPALSCIDDLAGDTVLTACEAGLFGSAESTAAALSYAASQITRLTALGDVAAANARMTGELQMVRRAVERDRYGLMAYALAARDHCTPSDCAAFRALADRNQIVANMNERTYEGLIVRYAPSWNAPAAAPAPAPVAALPSIPSGKPTNAEFPSAASTPPISIMTPEPVQATSSSTPRSPAATSSSTGANAPLPSPHPTSTTAPAAATLAAAKKQAGPKTARTAAPVQLAPAAPAPAAAAPEPTPSAAND